MKVLVAGGAGFVGSHLCARLLKDGHEVTALDSLLTGAERNLAGLEAHAGFRFERHDITTPYDYPVDAIFHLASPASPTGYMRHPFATIAANTIGTHQLLELARRHGARFLLASTSEAYGDPQVHPQREDYFGNVNSVGPRACYDESKRLGETITMEFHRQFGTDARIVRIFNTYGPHSQRDDGRMVPAFITQALAGAPLTVHGDGHQTRSLCYVSDLVEALTRAMFTAGTAGEVINLGNPQEQTVLEWANTIIRLCASPSSIVFEPGRQDDPERRCPDIGKAQRLLGWTPVVAPEDGLRGTIAWFRAEMEHEPACAPSQVR